MRATSTRFRAAFAALAALAALAGCGASGAPSDAEAQANARLYLEMVRSGDVDALYSISAPGVKDAFSRDDFAALAAPLQARLGDVALRFSAASWRRRTFGFGTAEVATVFFAGESAATGAVCGSVDWVWRDTEDYPGPLRIHGWSHDEQARLSDDDYAALRRRVGCHMAPKGEGDAPKAPLTVSAAQPDR